MNMKKGVKIEEILYHLTHNIKTELKPSNIDGVGVFAIRDIKKGENVFPKWEYETGLYYISNDTFNKLPLDIKRLVDRYYISREPNFRIFRLFNGQNFFYNSFCFCNSSYPNPSNCNISNDGYALRDIEKGEEILEDYSENISL